MFEIMQLMLYLANVDKESKQYDHCIYLHPCPNDKQDLKKLSKPEYMKEMKCRITRHLECIKTEIPEDKR